MFPNELLHKEVLHKTSRALGLSGVMLTIVNTYSFSFSFYRLGN